MSRIFSIVIPAYNEEQSIEKVILNLHKLYPLSEIIVVNDFSSDNTLAKLKDIKKSHSLNNLIIVNHKENKGPIQAIISGVKIASNDIVITYDADGQHPYKELHKIFEVLSTLDADIVLGTRKKLPRIGEILIAKVCHVSDATTGLRGFKKEHICYLINDFAYGGVFIYKCLKNGLSIYELPIKIKPREKGRSYHNNIRVFLTGVKFIIWVLGKETIFFWKKYIVKSG